MLSGHSRCCTRNKPFMKVYQWFYWNSNLSSILSLSPGPQSSLVPPYKISLGDPDGKPICILHAISYSLYISGADPRPISVGGGGGGGHAFKTDKETLIPPCPRLLRPWYYHVFISVMIKPFDSYIRMNGWPFDIPMVQSSEGSIVRSIDSLKKV
jgi:hypothetical protein